MLATSACGRAVARRVAGERAYTKYKTLIEPFRVRMVQALDMPTESQRAAVRHASLM